MRSSAGSTPDGIDKRDGGNVHRRCHLRWGLQSLAGCPREIRPQRQGAVGVGVPRECHTPLASSGHWRPVQVLASSAPFPSRVDLSTRSRGATSTILLLEGIQDPLQDPDSLLMGSILALGPDPGLDAGQKPARIDWVASHNGFDEVSPWVAGLSAIDFRERSLGASETPGSSADVSLILLIYDLADPLPDHWVLTVVWVVLEERALEGGNLH